MTVFQTLVRRFMPLQEVEACAPTFLPPNLSQECKSKTPSTDSHEPKGEITPTASDDSDDDANNKFEIPPTPSDEDVKPKHSLHASIFPPPQGEALPVLTKGDAPVSFDRMQRMVDWLVRVSGSKWFFCLTQACLVTWVFLGIPYSQTALWPIIIGNGQAIFSYILDTMLMRQQLGEFGINLADLASLRSRNTSKQRMVQALTAPTTSLKIESVNAAGQKEKEEEFVLPTSSRFARVLAKIALVTAHIFSVGIFCATQLVWLAFGPSTRWSNLWQLDLNSALSAWMVFLFSLLAVVREEDAACNKAVLSQVESVDAQIELRLRTLTKDTLPNSDTLIVLEKPDAVQRVINVYANIVGGLVGLVILVVAFVVWAAIGPLMRFNDNWWLLIGTYAGLIGLNDGFVLRNVQHNLDHIHFGRMQAVLAEDTHLIRMLANAGIPCPIDTNPRPTPRPSVTQRVSDAVCRVTAHRMAVVVGAISIVGLIVGASAMRWSLTGQLLCNIPPMIVESFFTQVLITGHLAGEKRRAESNRDLFVLRKVLLGMLEGVEVAE